MSIISSISTVQFLMSQFVEIHQLIATLSSGEFNFLHKKSRDSFESLLSFYHFCQFYDLLKKFCFLTFFLANG